MWLDSLNSLRVDGYLDGRASLAWLSPSLQAAGVIMGSMDFLFFEAGRKPNFFLLLLLYQNTFFFFCYCYSYIYYESHLMGLDGIKAFNKIGHFRRVMFAHLSTWILVYLMARGFRFLICKNILEKTVSFYFPRRRNCGCCVAIPASGGFRSRLRCHHRFATGGRCYFIIFI